MGWDGEKSVTNRKSRPEPDWTKKLDPQTSDVFRRCEQTPPEPSRDTFVDVIDQYEPDFGHPFWQEKEKRLEKPMSKDVAALRHVALSTLGLRPG